MATRSFSSPGQSSFGEVDPESGRDEGVSDVYALMGATAGASHELSSEATENVEAAREGHTHRSAVRTDGRGEIRSPTHRAGIAMPASDPTPPRGTNVSVDESQKRQIRDRALQSSLELIRDRLDTLARKMDEMDDEAIAYELNEAAAEAVAFRDLVMAWSMYTDESVATVAMDVPDELDVEE